MEIISRNGEGPRVHFKKLQGVFFKTDGARGCGFGKESGRGLFAKTKRIWS
jgi:hypothetical protein